MVVVVVGRGTWGEGVWGPDAKYGKVKQILRRENLKPKQTCLSHCANMMFPLSNIECVMIRYRKK